MWRNCLVAAAPERDKLKLLYSITRISTLPLFAAVCLFMGVANASDINTELRGYVQAGVPESPELSALLRREYQRRQYEPIWIGANELSDAGKEAFELVTRSEQLGLLRNYTDVTGLPVKPITDRYDYAGLARLDYQLSAGLVLLLTDVSEGHIPAIVDDSKWQELTDRDGTERRLSREIQTNFLGDLLKRESPDRPEYIGLLKELDRYNRIVERGGWPLLAADGPTLKPGMVDEQVAVLRQRLKAEGFVFSGNQDFPEEYDQPLLFALQRFQLNNGLNPDGIVGPNTRKILNIPAQQRRQQILVNLERMRWLPETLGSRYLWVNVPNYRLTIYDQAAEGENKAVLDMATIVGRPERPTPVFYDKIEYIEVNPYWNVPDSIAIKDYLPKIMADLSVFEKEHMKVRKSWHKDAEVLDPYEIDWLALFPEYAEVEPPVEGADDDIVDVDAGTVEKPTRRRFPFHLRQEPGPHNSLGRVKFMFPNEHYVYLHDTPKQYLFKRGQRAFSSGCVRVSNPSKLAQFLLDTQRVEFEGAVQMSMNAEGETVADTVKYEDVLNTGENTQVVLAESLPVYLVYFTAWVDSQGRLQFRPDIYDRDSKVAEQLAAVQNSIFSGSKMAWADTPKMFVEPKPEPAKETEGEDNLVAELPVETLPAPTEAQGSEPPLLPASAPVNLSVNVGATDVAPVDEVNAAESPAADEINSPPPVDPEPPVTSANIW